MMSREDIIRIREKMKRAKQKKKEAVKQSKIEKRLQDPETSKKKAENEEVSSKKPSCASSEENSKTIDNNAEELSQQKQSVETVKSVKQTPDSEASTQPVTSPTANDPTSNSNINPSQDQETNDKNQDGVVVLSEIDKILSEVKRNKSVNTTEALSDRLLQLALQLRNTNSPITTSSANTTPAVVNTEKEGPKIVSKVNPVTDVTGASSAPNIEQLTSTNPQNSGPVVSIGLDNSVEQQSISSAAKTAQPNSSELESSGAIASTVTAVATNVVDINTQIDYAQQVTVVNPLAQGILVASVQPIMSVKPLQGMELDTIQAQTLTDTEPAVIETDATRDTATPTQDDTYNPLQETMLQDSFRKTYPNFRGLSEVCKQHIGHSRNATSALQSIMQEADTLEERVQFPPKTPLTATDHIQALQTTSNLPNQQSNTTERLLPTNNSINLPKKQSSVQVRPQGLAHLEKMGPPFYVFDPRGDPNCDAIVTYLRRINGVPYHLHRVTEVLAAQRKNYLIGIKGMIGITDDILNCSLPAGRLWIVIRSADLSLLPSMPYLSMLKCAGPRVQFVQADTLDEVKSRRYHHIMSGEHGIILPVSANVIIDNPVVFTKIVNWMVQTRNDQVGEGKPLKNTWRLALYNHILEDLQATSDTRFGSELGQKAASSLIQLLKENSGIVVNLFARDQYSGNVSESDIVETAMELQLENLRHTRHVVVLTGHDQESPQWRRLRRAGVAVTTLDQFVQSIKQAKHNENPCQYSPLMRIYSTEIA
uniref:Uncharacterized protein LOC101243233 n=1 Tax=Phallusia mammillata TaxID=59560 RepID=A0A6F9DI75_9ASCI|nr:uncharacterized protein LOC101243233 [Phallusia mammillata]